MLKCMLFLTTCERTLVVDKYIRMQERFEYYCWASLIEPHCNIENSTVVHARRTESKNGIVTHSTVWYGGSCTSKRNKLMGTSIQVLSKAKMFGFIYWCSMLCWYSQPCHEEWMVKITVDPYKAGTVNYSMYNERQFFVLRGSDVVGHLQYLRRFLQLPQAMTATHFNHIRWV